MDKVAAVPLLTFLPLTPFSMQGHHEERCSVGEFSLSVFFHPAFRMKLLPPLHFFRLNLVFPAVTCCPGDRTS